MNLGYWSDAIQKSTLLDYSEFGEGLIVCDLALDHEITRSKPFSLQFNEEESFLAWKAGLSSKSSSWRIILDKKQNILNLDELEYLEGFLYYMELSECAICLDPNNLVTFANHCYPRACGAKEMGNSFGHGAMYHMKCFLKWVPYNATCPLCRV